MENRYTIAWDVHEEFLDSGEDIDHLDFERWLEEKIKEEED